MAQKKLEQEIARHSYPPLEGETAAQNNSGVDPYVKRVFLGWWKVSGKQLSHELDSYPIPELCLPQGNGKCFLEIGCNWGRWCISAAKKGYNVVGVDFSTEAIMAARRVARQLEVSATYIVADARHLPFVDNCFDVVFSYNVLQYFDKNDVKVSLAEVGRVLKTTGASLIQMLNVFGLRNLYYQLKRCFSNAQRCMEPSELGERYWSPSELNRTFNRYIGPYSLSAEGYFCLNPQKCDLPFLPLKDRLAVHFSQSLCRLSKKIGFLKYLADSLYVFH